MVSLIKDFTIIFMTLETLESYWLENGPYYDSRVVIYAHKMFIRMATNQWPFI